MTTDPEANNRSCDRNSKRTNSNANNLLILRGLTALDLWQFRCFDQKGILTEGAIMSQEIYCVARTDEEARNVVKEIKTLGVDPAALTVIARPDQLGQLKHGSEELRNACNGAAGGAVIGTLFGAA